MLLGNKVDKANRVITKEQGEKLAKVTNLFHLFRHIMLLILLILYIFKSNLMFHSWKQVQKLVKM